METDAGTILRQYGLDGLQGQLRGLFPRCSFSLEELLSALLRGDLPGCFRLFRDGVLGQLPAEAAALRQLFVSLLLLGLLSALLTHLTEAFQSRQVAQAGFYVMYLALTALLLGSFQRAAETTGTMAEEVVLFMKLLLPTYAAVMGLAAGGITAGVMYQLLFLLICGVEIAVGAVLLPAVSAYAFLNLVGGLWQEERMALLMEGIQKAVSFLLKAATTSVMGISLIQSMVTPVLDSLRGGAAARAVGAIPGLGDLAGGVAEMMIGSAVLIKNSVGACMLFFLAALCLLPLARLLAIAVLLKGAAALMGLTADKRMSACTDRMGEGCLLLFKAAVTILALFVITIALLSYTTNRGV